MAGTQNIKEIVSEMGSVAALIQGLQNGISGDDLGALFEVLRKAPLALDGAGEALVEYMDMDDAEAAGIEAEIMAAFGVSDGAIEDFIVTVLKQAVKLRSIISFLLKLILPK